MINLFNPLHLFLLTLAFAIFGIINLCLGKVDEYKKANQEVIVISSFLSWFFLIVVAIVSFFELLFTNL